MEVRQGVALSIRNLGDGGKMDRLIRMYAGRFCYVLLLVVIEMFYCYVTIILRLKLETIIFSMIWWKLIAVSTDDVATNFTYIILLGKGNHCGFCVHDILTEKYRLYYQATSKTTENI